MAGELLSGRVRFAGDPGRGSEVVKRLNLDRMVMRIGSSCAKAAAAGRALRVCGASDATIFGNWLIWRYEDELSRRGSSWPQMVAEKRRELEGVLLESDPLYGSVSAAA